MPLQTLEGTNCFAMAFTCPHQFIDTETLRHALRAVLKHYTLVGGYKQEKCILKRQALIC